MIQIFIGSVLGESVSDCGRSRACALRAHTAARVCVFLVQQPVHDGSGPARGGFQTIAGSCASVLPGRIPDDLNCLKIVCRTRVCLDKLLKAGSRSIMPVEEDDGSLAAPGICN